MEGILRPQHTLRSAPGACKIRAMKSLLVVLFSVAALAAVAPPLATLRASPSTPPRPSRRRRPLPHPRPRRRSQTTEPVQGPTFRTGVDLVTVDVAVVDRAGSPVEDLRAPDFAVKIDGEVRRVVSAELVKVDVEAREETGRRQDRDVLHQQPHAATTAGTSSSPSIRSTSRPASLQPIMAAAQRFLDRLSPLDQVAFIAYPEPGPRVNFTNDKLRLRLAMQGLIGQPQRVPAGQQNIGVTEALAIDNRRDQIVLADVVARECRGLEPQQRAQCERDIITAVGADRAPGSRGRRPVASSACASCSQRLLRSTGHKSLILISEGLAVDDQNELASIVQLAGQARTSINVLVVDLRRGDVTISEQPPTEQAGPPHPDAGARGAGDDVARLPVLHRRHRRADLRAPGVGDLRLLPAGRRAAAERQQGRPPPHRRRGPPPRRHDPLASGVRAVADAPTRKSPDGQLRDALSSPFAVSGLPLRVTTFAQQDPASDKVRLTIAAQVGQPGAPSRRVHASAHPDHRRQPDRGQLVATSVTLSPLGASPNEPLAFVGGVLVDPGIYSLRFGVVDAEGRRGSVVRDVNAWKMAGEALAFGDLIVGNMPAPGRALRAASSRT